MGKNIGKCREEKRYSYRKKEVNMRILGYRNINVNVGTDTYTYNRYNATKAE